MAQISFGEVRWRMVRRVLKKKRFNFEDVRSMNRHDRAHFEWLVAGGFFEAIEGEWYRVTPKGAAAADLGLYEV